MSAQICAERNAYYTVLEKTQRGDLDITRWLEWFLGCLDRAILGADSILNSVLEKSLFWSKYKHEIFNERQHKILLLLLGQFEGKNDIVKMGKNREVLSGYGFSRHR
jgi:Fic family protein